MPIEAARSIGKVGFRRWYERQLLEGHVWLVTCLLCGAGMVAGFETLDFGAAPVTAIVTSGFMFAAGALCIEGFRRYRDLMQQAQHVASQTACPQCRTNARFQVLDPSPRMRVCCRKCGHEWVID